MSLPIASDRSAGSKLGLGGPVIGLERVGVRYRIPHERVGTLKEYVIRRVQGRIGFREHWALRAVSLEVLEGEVLGVIGRNGAGKSTLLKVVSRVLRPATGRVWTRGRVAPLLDLGAGFHPELTGRENVLLNGTLLGRSEREVSDRFDDILRFADVAGFVDAPLRTYSSGMIARLGFAVATAWRPDVLILDEVLAVGDETFQRKCLERIQSFHQSGTTVLLVSHDLTIVQSMCHRAAWIDGGRIVVHGPADEAVSAYLRQQS